MAAKRRQSVSWKTETMKREEVINKELTMQINNRRRMSSSVYGDLNFLLVNKDRLAKLSASREDGRVATSKLIIKPKEITEARELALMTASNSFSTQEGTRTRETIIEFIRKVFKLTSEQIDQAEMKASQQPPPKLHLICKVMQAKELKSKDSNGIHHRNFFCRLGTLNRKYLESSSEFKFLTEWQKLGAASDVATTSVKAAMLEPVWNEDIKLSIENMTEDQVIVELWEDVHQEKKKNFKALISLNKEELLSWMSHPLSHVSLSGVESQFPLTSRSKRTHKGFVNLFMSIQADTNKQLELYKVLAYVNGLFDVGGQVSLHEHHILTRALISECSKDESEGDSHAWNWSGELCRDSEKLLQYHGSLNGLNKLQLISVRLSELLKYHRRAYGIDIKAFHKLVLEVKQLEGVFLLATDSSCSPPVRSSSSSSPTPQAIHQVVRVASPPTQNTHQWEKQLFADLSKLESELVDMLHDHIRLAQFGYDGDLAIVFSLLSTLKDLYSVETYVQRMAPKKLSSQVEGCFVPSVKSWFTLLKKRVMPTNGSQQSELRDLCSHCLLWTEKAQEQLHPKCKEIAGVDYFTHYLVKLDTLLSAEVTKCLEEYKRYKIETYTFEIYTTFQRFVQLSEHIDTDYHEKLSFLTFHKWFEEFVPGWIKLSREKCESRIEQAIKLDEIVKITKDLSLSSSAVDTKGFLHQLAAFWQHVDWPVASEAYGFAVSMIENMCCCAEFYVGKIFASLSSQSLRDEHGRFKASEKLCLILNNMYHVREFLAELPVHMELNNFYARLEVEDKMRDSLENSTAKAGMSLTVRAKSLVGNFVTNADEDILRKVHDVARKICNKLSPDIQAFVSKIVRRRQDEDKNYLLTPLFDYLTENLTTLGNHLLPAVFESITATLWEVSVTVMEQLSKTPRKKDLLVHQRLFDTLMSLRDFYYCDGDGVSGRALDCDTYLTLHEKLSILHTSTNELISQFYSELMRYQREQSEKGTSLGELVFSVGYFKDTSTVEVNVVQAKDIGQLHEPYVKLRLSSVCRFTDRHWKTRPVKGGKKAPSFSEEFNLPITEEEMNKEGSLVLFYLFDKQQKQKSHLGMCAVACKDIPRLSQATLTMSLSDPMAPQRRNYSLPLFQFSMESPTLTELIARTDLKDVNATKFLKMNELLLRIVNNNGTRIRSKTQ